MKQYLKDLKHKATVELTRLATPKTITITIDDTLCLIDLWETCGDNEGLLGKAMKESYVEAAGQVALDGKILSCKVTTAPFNEHSIFKEEYLVIRYMFEIIPN